MFNPYYTELSQEKLEVKNQLYTQIKTLAKKDFEAYEYGLFLTNVIEGFSSDSWENQDIMQVCVM